MKYAHKQPHGLTFEERDKLAKERGLYRLATLPNTDGYKFHGYAIDGWRFNCHIWKDSKDIHRVGGEATFDQLIGWKPIMRRCDVAACNCGGEHPDIRLDSGAFDAEAT